MENTVAWLRDRPYYDGQVQLHQQVSGRSATFRDVDVESRLGSVLTDDGIEQFYDHQAAAIEAVRDGQNTVLATRTASGKSLAYTVPAFERALADSRCTLYIAPQVALINDQADTLSELAHGLGFGSRVRVDQYTGRLSKSEKRDVRDRQPTVLLTTPDMLHYGILPHARRLWDWFVERLDTVVIDEVHEYRGVFGSHVSLVLRRLARVCEEFDADPQFVCCSATIGNPTEHASAVTGQPASSFALVDEDTSTTGPTHWLFWNPPEYDDESQQGRSDSSGRRQSSHTETKRLFADLVSRGFQTVAFTSARQAAERYASESADALRDRGHGDLASSVTAYQAALPQSRRNTIEDGLHDGSIRGVWSTNALELGVDIGELDVVLLDGYPDTRMSTHQRAGRAGRGDDPSLVVLVAGEDQLDQYLMDNPADFFDGDPEQAVVNPANDQLMPDHVLSAARESWLTPEDREHFSEAFPPLVADLEESGDLDRRSTNGVVRWTYGGDGSPQHEMSLRTIDDRTIQLRDRQRGETVGQLPFGDGLRDAHPGAIYHHQGQTYEVAELDLSHDTAGLESTWADYYTQVLHDKQITVEEDLDAVTLSTREDVTVRFAEVTMRKQITGYERRDRATGESLGRFSLDLPETSLRTRALYFTVPESVETAMRAADGNFDGGIHAAEHAMIAMFPFELLCDRRDIGGLSTPLHPHTNQSTIFIYDGYPGGVGLTRAGYDDIETLLRRTREMIENCSCAEGCPACVQSPHCGNANDPLDKGLAVMLLDRLLDSA
ncbi:DEAD/DEAH box helicase [Halococcus sp. PRR34]|uniref:DEAD/DEAH box helicase n=1 Tax=Halococcus sp. PRR34 TaxID=3020830 RepID=UPI0023626356|nr:DEAD/DEAH box helicase [Halococcus sp. PRR34]